MTFTSLNHEGLDQLHESQGRDRPHAEALLKRVQVLFHQRSRVRRDGVVDQDVDTVIGAVGFCDESVQLFQIADIALQRSALCSKALPDLGAGLVTLL